MNLHRFSLIIAFLLLFGAAGYAIGMFVQAPDEVMAALQGGTVATQRFPLPLSPADGSEFADSDIVLEWSWAGGLAANQRYALRVWTDDKPYHEVWTVDTTVPVQRIIDSFSLAFGKYYWQVAVINLDSEGEYASPGSEWSPVQTMQRLRRERIPTKPYHEMSAAAKQFHDLHLGASELIDAVHVFINQNSLSRQQLRYAPDFSDAVQLMYDHSRGLTSEMPQLQCDGRSTAMLTILNELGIESRLIFLYKSDPGWISEHTVLEIFNPDTQYWQVHDLSNDIYFVAGESRIRVDAESMLFGPHDDILGCPIAGGPCSADLSASGLGFFSALRYGFTYEVWVNPDRFDLSAILGAGQPESGGVHRRRSSAARYNPNGQLA